jgi:transcriptional regulator with XRE-family HTH domain
MFVFGNHLKDLRHERNITQKQLAEAVNLSERGIQNYELNSREPSMSTLIALANYFGVSIDYLVGRIQKDYLTMLEEAEDEYLLALVEERKKNDNGVRISFEEHLAKRGLTVEDIEKMEDVELEYELPD